MNESGEKGVSMKFLAVLLSVIAVAWFVVLPAAAMLLRIERSVTQALSLQ